MKYWREKETKTMKVLGVVAKGMFDIRWIFSLFILFIFIKDLRNWIMT
tara:strand:- start:10981 stop:11124 length:144 start_codon:yes stop_codon:yes gene_type:complete